MNLKGPLILLISGALLSGLGWLSTMGPVDHNIGRSIANSLLQQGATVFGALLAGSGFVWLLVRLFASSPGD